MSTAKRICNRLLDTRVSAIDLDLPLHACWLEVQIEEERASCCLQGCVRMDLQASRDGKRWTTVSHAAWVIPNVDGPLQSFPLAARSAKERRRLRIRLASFEPMPVHLQVFVSPRLEETVPYAN